MDDCPSSPSPMQEVAVITKEYSGIKVEKLQKLVLSKFFGTKLKCREYAHALSPIIKYSVNKLDRGDCDGGKSLYTSTKGMLSEYF